MMDGEDESKDYRMVMPFVDQSNSFTHGFECGQIWEQMKKKVRFDEYLFHKNNIKQVELMCMHYHYTCKVTELDTTWCLLTAELDLAKAN